MKIIFVLVIILCNMNNSYAKDFDASQLLQNMKTTIDSVRSASGTSHYTYCLIDSLDEKYKNNNFGDLVTYEEVGFKYAFENNKYRCTEINTRYGFETTVVTEGIIFQRFTKSVGKDDVRLRGIIAENINLDDSRHDPFFYPKFLMNFVEYLKQNSKQFTLDIAGTEIMNNTECTIVTYRFQTDAPIVEVTFWIAEKYSFLPLKITRETVASNDEAYCFLELFDFTYDSVDGYHIPVHYYYEKCKKEPGQSQYKKTLSKEWKLNNDWKINVDIDDSIFLIDFPKGTTVTDKRTGEKYTVK